MNPVTKHPEFYVQNLRLVSTPYDQSKVQEFVETFDKKALSRNLPNILDLFKELDEFEELIPPRPNQKPLRCPPPYNPRMARPNQYGPFGACVGQVQAQFPPAVVPTPVTLPLSQQKQQQQHQMLADLNRPPQTPLSCNSMPQTPGSSSSNARSPKMRHMSTTSDTYGELETLQSLSHSFQSDMGSSQTHQNTPMGGLGSSSADSDSSSCAVTPVVESRATSVGGGCGQSSIAAATPLNDFPHHGERKSSLQDTIDSVVLATVSSANPQPSMSVNSPIMTSASSHDFSPRRRPSEASSVFDLRQTPSEDLIITSPTPSSAPVCGVAQPPPMMMGASGSTSSGQHLPSSQIQRTQRAASISLPSQQQQQAALDVFEFDQAAEQQQQQLYDPMGGSGSNVVVPTPHHRWSAPNIGVIGGYGGEPDFQAATMGYNPDGSMSGYMTYQDANQNPQFHQQLMRNGGDQSSMGAGGNIASMRGAPGNGIRRRRSRRNAVNVGDRTYEQAMKEMKKAEKAAMRGAKAPRRPRRPRGSSTIQSLAPGTSHVDTAAKMRVKFYGNSGEMLGEHQNFSEETSSSFSSDANFSVGNPNSALSIEMQQQQQQQIRCQQQQQLNLTASKQRKDSFSNSSQMNQTAAYNNMPDTPTKEKDFSTMSAHLQRQHSFDAAAVAFEHSMSLTSSQQHLYRSDSQSQQHLQQHQMLQQRLFSSQGDAIHEEQKRRSVKEDLVAPRVMEVESGDVFEEESDENDDEMMMHSATHGLTTQQASNLFENLSKTIPTMHGNKDSPSSVQANNSSILSSTKRKGSILDDVIGKLTNRCQTSTGPFVDESSSSSIPAMPSEADVEPTTKRAKFDMQEDCPTDRGDYALGKDFSSKSAATNFQLPQQSATNNNNSGARAPTPQQKMLAKQLSAASSNAGGDQSCSSSSTTSSEHSPATTSTTGLKLVIRKRDLKLIDQQQQQHHQQQMIAGNNSGQSANDSSITQQLFSSGRESGSQNVSVPVRNVQTPKMTSATKQNSTSNMSDFAAAKAIQNLQQQNQQQILKRASPSLLAAAENHVKQALAGGLTVQQMVQQRQQQDLNSAASLKFNDYKQKVQEKKLKKVVSVAGGSSSTATSSVAAGNVNVNNLNQSAATLLGFSALKAAALQHNLTPVESAKLTAKLLEKVQSAAGKATKVDNERKNITSNQPQQQINVTSASTLSISAASSGSANDQSSVFPGTEGIIFSKTLTGYKIPKIDEKTTATAGGSSPAAASSSPHRKAPPFPPPTPSTAHFTAGAGQQTLPQQQSVPKKPKSILKNSRSTNSASSNAPSTFGGADREPAPPAVGQFAAQQHFNTPPAAARVDASHSNAAAAAAAAAAVAAALNQQKRQPLLPDPAPAFFAAAAAAAAGGGDTAQQQAAIAAQVISTFGTFLPMGTAARAAAAAVAAPAASSSRTTPQRNDEDDFVLTTEAPASPDDM